MVLTLERDERLHGPMRLNWFAFGGDPTIRRSPTEIWASTWTSAGPATLHYRAGAVKDERYTVQVEGYGPGAEMALARAAHLLGDADDGEWARGTVLEDARRRTGPVCLGGPLSVADNVLRHVFGQRVTTREATRGYRALVQEHGGPAPGPCEGLMLAPRGEVLMRLPYYELHRFGVERKRAHTIQLVGKRADYLEAAWGQDFGTARTRMARLHGIGPWTIENTLADLADPDAVQVGDYHLPNLVSWAFAKEPRADDTRMLELLQPFAGHRQRALRLLSRTVQHAPRYGPRNAPSRWTKDHRY